MKRILALCLVMLMLLCAAAETDMANPVTQYASLSEINEIVGSNLIHPAVMGVTEESFSIIKTDSYDIAQYCFSVNGLEYTMRCAAVAYEDISGVYVDADPAFDNEYSGETEYAFCEDLKLSRWLDINGQYVIILNDPDNVMEVETFKAITEEFIALTSIVPSAEELSAFYAALEGDYQDAFSQRAAMTVTAKGAEGAIAEIHWAGSAFDSYDWTMTIRLAEDGLLCYSDCVKTLMEYPDESTFKTTTLYEDGEGFFSFSEGKLYWNGAAAEECQECVFEKDE